MTPSSRVLVACLLLLVVLLVPLTGSGCAKLRPVKVRLEIDSYDTNMIQSPLR